MKSRFFIIPFALLPIFVRSHPMVKPRDNIYELRASKTTIVSYRKNNIKGQDILKHQRRLESICNCEVTHLRHVGAFILSYDHKDHTPADALNLGIENGIAVEDRVISTLGGSVRPVITNHPPNLTNDIPDDPLVRFELDCTDVFCQAPEEEEFYADPPPEWLAVRTAAVLPTNFVWRLLK